VCQQDRQWLQQKLQQQFNEFFARQKLTEKANNRQKKLVSPSLEMKEKNT
jgi:hypothetical protein